MLSSREQKEAVKRKKITKYECVHTCIFTSMCVSNIKKNARDFFNKIYTCLIIFIRFLKKISHNYNYTSFIDVRIK